jgi:hypothetical protein
MSQTLTLSDYIGLTGISTFLIGFMSVKLDSNVAAARSRSDALLARLANEARDANLLPLPADMRRLARGLQSSTRGADLIAVLTVLISVCNLALSASLAHPHLVGSNINREVLGVHLVHLLIILLGLIHALIQTRSLTALVQGGPAADYLRLELSLETIVDNESLKSQSETRQPINEARELCRELMSTFPGWCWIDLIYADLSARSDADFHSGKEFLEDLRPSLIRLRDISSASKEGDVFSLLAWTWCVTLLNPSSAGGLISRVEEDQLSRLNGAGVLRDLVLSRYNSLREVAP